MSKNLTPSEVVERIIGRPEVIGLAIGIGQKAPYHWRRASKGRAAGDITSASHMRRLLAYAAAHRLPLKPDHLIWGADEAEIIALLAAMPPAQPAQAAE